LVEIELLQCLHVALRLEYGKDTCPLAIALHLLLVVVVVFG
jgi:hypothetical protein